MDCQLRPISALVSKNADEESLHASFNPEADVTANRLVQEVEDKLEDIDPSDLTGLSVLSETLLSGCKELTDTPCDREQPLGCAMAAVEARDNANAKDSSFVQVTGFTLSDTSWDQYL